jgi:Ser/Thr protein kinase RdoA (MazF antagonist)
MPEIGALLGSGNVAEAFEYGPHVLKLYRYPDARSAAFIEAATLSMLADHGLPTPRVHRVGLFEGRWGLVMDRAAGETLARFTAEGVELVPGGFEEMLRLHRRIHAEADPRLPALTARLRYRIARIEGIDQALRARLLARLAKLPDGDRLCHGDFHPFNIVGMPGSALVIDWLDAASGPPAADVARSYMLIAAAAEDFAEGYVAAYAQAAGIAPAEIMAWVPVVAAARLVHENADANERARLLRMIAATLD